VVVVCCLLRLGSSQSANQYPACRDFGHCSVLSVGTVFTFFPVAISSAVTSIDMTGHPIGLLRGPELVRFGDLQEM
jgi:hypothetical protein